MRRKQGRRGTTAPALLIATSRAAVADGATPVLPEPRWALPTNSPQDDDARYADSATALRGTPTLAFREETSDAHWIP